MRKVEALDRELQGNLALQKQAREGVVGASQREAQANAGRERARLQRDLLGRAEILEGRADATAGNARRLGAMNQYDQAFGVNAAKLIADRGSVKNLPQEVIQAALGIAPETVGKIVERTGTNSAAFKSLSDGPRFEADYAGDQNELRRRAAKLRRRFAEEDFSTDSQLASDIAGTFQGFGRDVGDMIRRAVEAAKAEILNTTRLGRNSQ